MLDAKSLGLGASQTKGGNSPLAKTRDAARRGLQAAGRDTPTRSGCSTLN